MTTASMGQPTPEAALAWSQLQSQGRRPLTAMLDEQAPGIYAWWGVPLPPSFPDVPAGVPSYIGIAERESLAARAAFHLQRTRSSAPRRTLAALLVDELDLEAELVADARSWGLTPAGEQRLSEWMGTHVTATWLPLDTPEPIERNLIAHLLPPLNHTHATGSPYRRPLQQQRARVRDAARRRRDGCLG